MNAPAPRPLPPALPVRLVALWIHDLDEDTQRAYVGDVTQFAQLVQLADLRDVTLADLHHFEDELRNTGAAPATIARKLAAVKSLLTFAHRTGALAVNVGAAKRLPKVSRALAERILQLEEVVRLFVAARSPRDAALMRTIYYGGLRNAEAAALRWEHVGERGGRGLLSIHGKGGLWRPVLVPAPLYTTLVRLRGAADRDAPVFASGRGGGPLGERAVHGIVARSARRAGLPGDVSPHWLRHAHVSHALDRGAPIHLVRQTVGHGSLATTGRYAHARPDDSSALYLPAL